MIDLYILSTLDGKLTAFDRKTGEEIWAITDYMGTMVNVKEYQHPFFDSKGIFIPEIASGIGRLYYYSNDGIKRAMIPLKEIINEHSVFIDDQYVFTGKKVSTLLKIDAETGQVLCIYGGDHALEPQILEANNVIYLSKTMYFLFIYDKKTSALRWNISYGEFNTVLSTSKSNQKSISLLEEKLKGKSRIDAGKILQQISSPLLASFDVLIDDGGNRIMLKSNTMKESGTTFVGEIDGSLYMLPMSQELHSVARYEKKELILSSCEVGSPLFPDCLLGVHQGKELVKANDQIIKMIDLSTIIISLFIGSLLVIIFFLSSKITKKKEKQDPRPKCILISDHVLGIGSHGTVVYSGIFEGRKVAVKRLLKEFYDLADAEVKLLQESDSHPNVVRYFFKEECDRFMYLALELCPASLFDLVENSEEGADLQVLRQAINAKDAIHQILSGINHLHGLNIVHRDIKPQNILITDFSSSGRSPRFLISDFGLGKRLEEEQSFFHVSNASFTGTQGWRAPECIFASKYLRNETLHSQEHKDGGLQNVSLQPNNHTRITKSVDIFSTGCILYYILTNGFHPFGHKLNREHNIVKGNVQIEKLENLENGVLARDLIKRMISADPARRPAISTAITHPYFWSPIKQLNFLQDVSDRLENECKYPPSNLILKLESDSSKVLGKTDWLCKLDENFVATLGKYRKYDILSIQDLMRVIRNKKHHYADLPIDVQKTIGELPDGYLMYFSCRFPKLLIHVYYYIADNPELSGEKIFQIYFQNKF